MTGMTKFTRREFLKLAALSVTSIYIPPFINSRRPTRNHHRILQLPPASLGRIASGRWQAVRQEPDPYSELLGYKKYNEIIKLYSEVKGKAPWQSNNTWYRTGDGFIHSSYVQPVENHPQSKVVKYVQKPGFWGEISVPIAEARRKPESDYVSRNLYYGTIYRAVDAVKDKNGDWWYLLHEGLAHSADLYVRSETLQRLSPQDLAPISPGRPDKWIQVDRGEQTLTCFEGKRAVYHTPVATGIMRKETITPLGTYHVIIKRHTRHMVGGAGTPDEYNLPGIAFPVYFTWSGIAIHGTYWHNDFGRPKSHGCINVRSQDAKWIFRWVEPATPYDTYSQEIEPATGTRVEVI